MSEENKAIVRRLYQEAINAGDLAVLDEIYDPEAELHLVGVPEDPFGPGPIRQLVSVLRAAFPGIRASIEDVICEGEKVVVRATFRLPHGGRLLGVSPQVPLAVWSRIDVYRLFRGRIVEQWCDRDELSLLRQLGVYVPPVGQAGQTVATGYLPAR